jgi:hypothetical protein
MRWNGSSCIGFVVVFWACTASTTTEPDGGVPNDGGLLPDSGVLSDSGSADAGRVDAGSQDAGSTFDGGLTDAGFPPCNAPISSVAAPDGPHGLFVLQFPGTPLTTIDTYLVNNPVVCGGNIFVVWSEVDKGPGANPRYDWSGVDSQIATWTGAGKSANLIVWVVSDATTNTATPSWVLSQVPTVSCTTTSPVPVFWNSTFVSLYKDFIAEVLATYGTNPSIGYIRFGLAAGGETYPVCYSALVQQGFTTTIWENYISTMMNYEKSLNPTSQLMLGINSYGAPPDDAVPDWEAATSVQLGFGFGSQGLSAADMQNYNTGKPCSVDWCANFEKYEGQAALELQLLAASQPDGGGEGSLVTLLPFALQLHTQIFEIFANDFDVAYDPNNPYYAQYGAGYREVFESTAKVVGGR